MIQSRFYSYMRKNINRNKSLPKSKASSCLAFAITCRSFLQKEYLFTNSSTLLRRHFFFYRQKIVIANKPITNPMMTPVGSLEVPLEVPPDTSVAAD